MTPLGRHLFAAMSAAAFLLAPLLSPASGEPPPHPGGTPRVSEILAWTSEVYTRVAIYTGDEVAWKVATPCAPTRSGGYRRAFEDLSQLYDRNSERILASQEIPATHTLDEYEKLKSLNWQARIRMAPGTHFSHTGLYALAL